MIKNFSTRIRFMNFWIMFMSKSPLGQYQVNLFSIAIGFFHGPVADHWDFPNSKALTTSSSSHLIHLLLSSLSLSFSLPVLSLLLSPYFPLTSLIILSLSLSQTLPLSLIFSLSISFPLSVTPFFSRYLD